MSAASQTELMENRSALIKKAFRLEYLTLGWMLVEAVVAIVAAIAAGSLTLLAFGIDSVIEIASALVVLWRLRVELRRGEAEEAETTAAKIGGALLLALAVYVIANAGWKVWTHQGAEFSTPGLAVSALALPVMYVLSKHKLRVADALGSRALRADAIESVACGWLSLVVVGAMLAQLALGAWWVDATASLGVIWFLIREGLEAWEERNCSECERD